MNRRKFLANTARLALLALAESANGNFLHANSSELRVQRLSWAGIKLEIPSVTLFIDPLINTGVWGDALKQPIVPIEASTKQRHVLVTHLHPDHFDVQAAKQVLNEDGNLYCHIDSAAIVASRGVRVRGVKLWEPILVGDFTITAVPAVDGYDDVQVSWVVAGAGRKIIHCGDTMMHGAYWKIGRHLGPFDAAFLPINGAKFRWRPPQSEVPSVMTPEQAVAAGVVMGAKMVIPIHYGISGADGYEEYAHAEAAFIEIARKRNLPVAILQPGEWVQWKL
ncbi:MBL fold metallo-hydrolase [bacterium]|nr:MBL fold metallo-hydrolase [bacterium]MCI0601748.1 MBL fold metallo-hydrolase [bacterium]